MPLLPLLLHQVGSEYQMAPRAMILRRDHGAAKNIEGLKRLLRANGYRDPTKTDSDATTVKKVVYDFPENWLPARSRFEALRGEECQALWQYMSHQLASVRVEAEKLLEEEQASFRAWITSLGAVPAITKLQTKAEDLRQAELKRADKKLQSLSSREIEAVERLSRGIVSKLLHGPMSSLRGEGSTDDKKNTLSALKKMFGV